MCTFQPRKEHVIIIAWTKDTITKKGGVPPHQLQTSIIAHHDKAICHLR
jgi:hypothetical protein